MAPPGQWALPTASGQIGYDHWAVDLTTGRGLRAALVDQQATLHGGTLLLADAQSGGLRALLGLPRRNPPQPP